MIYLFSLALLLINTALGAICLYLAFGGVFEASAIDWWVWAIATYTLTFGLIGPPYSKERLQDFSKERLIVNLVGLTLINIFLILGKVF